MQRILDALKEKDLLRVIDEELDIDLEIPHIAYVEAKKPDSKALLFTHPISKRLDKKFDIPVAMNIFGSMQAMQMIFEKHPDDIAQQIEKLLHLKPPSGFLNKMNMLGELFSLKSVFPKRLSRRGASQEIVFEDPNLFDLPILKTWPQDGGAFITMGQVYTQSLDGTSQNLGMYRLQVYDEKRLGMHWQIHKDSAHFFHEYKEAGKKMPVSIGIGGDPLYIWCGQAPMPNGMFELMLYGLVRGKNAKLVKSLTNPIFIPNDVDFVIEGWVDPALSMIEGPFGDHTGYYTLKEPYPMMAVTCITSKKNPIFQATVVGKPPLEDKYMGYATERIFLPLLRTTAPDLIDYVMPENGVFHNLIIAKMKTLYPGHAKQFMHAFWGVGQMSFVKHAFFVPKDAPKLSDYEALSDFICDRISLKNILISEGVCDALDHASPNACYGGKLGVDCTGDKVANHKKNLLKDDELYAKITLLIPEAKNLKQYKLYTRTPIVVISIEKHRSTKVLYEALASLKEHIKLVIFVDDASNSVDNAYMLLWRVVNNIDALRDIFLQEDFIGIDATNKSQIDGYTREWPEDTNCDPQVIKSLQDRGFITKNKEFLKKYHV
ncbi:MAG: menaquinone biosynthesis decarboxylase [Sulfurospirillum sp.]|nr:menaquinone biosynthesis decarboxylase [Sulfurospirillum sp.]